MQGAITLQKMVLPPIESLEYEITVLTAEIIELDSAEIWAKRDAHFFKDMQIDSLLALEILATLEKRYYIEVPEERLAEITSLASTIELVRSLQ
jgi:acyl carrier protein